MAQLISTKKYEVQQNNSTADAVALLYSNESNSLVQYPFKFTNIEDNEVRIQLTYAALKRTEAYLSKHEYQGEYPWHEVTGVVQLVGKSVTKCKIGDKVGVNAHKDLSDVLQQLDNQANKQQYIKNYLRGYTTHFQVKEDYIIILPKDFDDSKGAALIRSAGVVYAPLKRFSQKNSQCAVIGGGVQAQLAVQYATKLGMKVTAYSRYQEDLSVSKKNGAKNTILIKDYKQLQQQEGQFELVLNSINESDTKVYHAMQRLTSPGGVFVNLQINEKELEIDHFYVFTNEILFIHGIEWNVQDTQDALIFSSQNNIYPIIERFEFTDYSKAYSRMDTDENISCIVNCGKWSSMHLSNGPKLAEVISESSCSCNLM